MTSPFRETAEAQSARFRERGWWRNETWLDDLGRAAMRQPDRSAIFAHRALSRDDVRRSYAELRDWVDRFAGALLALGVERRQIVAVQLPNWWQFNAVAPACARIGAIVAPIPVDYRSRELAFILQRTEAPLYIGPAAWMGFSHRDMLREIAATTPSLRWRALVGLDGEAGAGELDFDAHFNLSRDERHPPEELDRLAPSADDVCLVMYTSGTSGEPKGVVHSYNTLYAATRALAETMGLGGHDVIGSPSPVTGLAGFFYNFLVPLYAGGSAVYCDVADPDRLLTLAEEQGVTLLYAVPAQLLALIQAQERLRKKTAALKGVVTGSAPIPPALIRSVREVFGVRLHALWGMTECGGVTFTRQDDPEDWPANSDGSPISWMEIKIVPAEGEDSAGLPAGTGRLLVRGAMNEASKASEANEANEPRTRTVRAASYNCNEGRRAHRSFFRTRSVVTCSSTASWRALSIPRGRCLRSRRRDSKSTAKAMARSRRWRHTT
ncbi:MAG TPA: AMP-binding protein [Polyangiaceae bacterium]|nr:AMP-binding protein [Polyangiaceae bacterium]